MKELNECLRPEGLKIEDELVKSLARNQTESQLFQTTTKSRQGGMHMEENPSSSEQEFYRISSEQQLQDDSLIDQDSLEGDTNQRNTRYNK